MPRLRPSPERLARGPPARSVPCVSAPDFRQRGNTFPQDADKHARESRGSRSRYLDEFAYRFNRRGREGELFDFVTRRLVTMEPVTYATSP